MFTNITNRIGSSFSSCVYDDPKQLSRISNGPFALGSRGLKKLVSETGALQLRIYCRKDRTLHMVTKNNTLGWPVLKYFSDITETTRPTGCGSFYRISDDDSVLSRKCQSWQYSSGKWSHPTRVNKNLKLYDHTIYIAKENHIYFNKDCDDGSGDSGPGLWQFYIR